MANTSVYVDVIARDRASKEFGKVGDSTEAAGKKAGKFGDMLEGVGGKLTGLAGPAAAGVIALKSIGDAMGQEKSADRMAAALGATPAMAKKFGNISAKLYAGAWGESMDDVNHAVESVASSFPKVGAKAGPALEKLTTQALDFASTFETDVPRAVEVASVVMKSGLAKNGQEAFDLLTRASQKVPAALRGDVLDAAEEYSTFFNSVGIDGPQAFAMLANGSKLGTYGIDKVGDAIKEFTIRATDGSDASNAAFKAIGLNADEMSNAILAGGDKSNGALQKIVGGLLKIKDPSKRAQMSLALFGTPLEDLNVNQIPTFLRALKDGGKGMDNWKGSIDRAGKTLNDNAATNLESFKRSATQTFVNVIGGSVVPKIDAFVKRLADMGVTANGVAKTVMVAGSAFAIWKTGAVAFSIWSKAAALARSVALGTRIQLAALRAQTIAHAVASKISAAATIAWSVASKVAAVGARVLGVALRFAMGPWGLLIMAIAAGAFLIIKNWDKIKAATGKVWGWIKKAIGSAFEFLKKVFFNFTGPGLLIKHWDKIKKSTSAAMTFLKSSISKFAGFLHAQFTKLVKKVGDWGKKLGVNLWNGIKAIATKFREFAGWLWRIWSTPYRVVGTKVYGAAKAIGGRLWNGIKTIGRTLATVGSWAWDRVRGGLDRLKSRFTSAGARLLSGLVSGLRNQWSKVKELTKKPLNLIIDVAINPFIGAVNKLPGVNIDKVKGFSRGGWTGPGSKYQPAGVVHADEYVINKRSRGAIERRAPGFLDYLNGFASGGRVWPLAGGMASTYAGHSGVDLNAPNDYGKPVHAVTGGTAYGASVAGSYGNHVNLYTASGVRQIYAHLAGFGKLGRVSAGDTIGYVGSTGNSTGPHLHFEVRPGGTYSSAMAYLSGASNPKGGGGLMGSIFGKFKDGASWFKDKMGSLLPKVKGGGLFSSSAMKALAKHILEGVKSKVPGFATGGMVKASPGGSLIRVGEGGMDEAIVPIMGGRRRGGSAAPIVVQVKVEGSVIVERDLIDSITRGIDQARRSQGQRTSILKVS